jgi:uncharacterized protein (TIGR00297 family)
MRPRCRKGYLVPTYLTEAIPPREEKEDVLMTTRIVVGTGLSAIIGSLARWRGMLTMGGVVGSMLIGTIVFSVGGLAWSIVVVTFFVSSSLLSRVSSERKRRVAADKFSKPGARDLFQTIANGGIGTLAALAYGLRRRRPSWLHAAFVGAFATATADTWATEIGTLTHSQPRLVTTGKPVPPGTSGGMTWLGTAAALAGGLTLGLTSALASGGLSKDRAPSGAGLIAAGLSGGLCGTLVDSLLGATVQQVYYCPRCRSETERTIHTCGTSTTPLRGWGWMDNDTVNLLSTAGGAMVGASAYWLLSRAATSLICR